MRFYIDRNYFYDKKCPFYAIFFLIWRLVIHIFTVASSLSTLWIRMLLHKLFQPIVCSRILEQICTLDTVFYYNRNAIWIQMKPTLAILHCLLSENKFSCSLQSAVKFLTEVHFSQKAKEIYLYPNLCWQLYSSISIVFSTVLQMRNTQRTLSFSGCL